MTRDELSQLETYLRKTFKTDTIEIRARPKKKDSAEVYIGDEFVGVIYRDDEDGEVSYQFQMAILEMDLE
jgi:predicted RNA-binding protein (virulence factor B family)